MVLERETLLRLYRKMILTRKMEEHHAKLLNEGKMHLMGHFGTGQEAVGVGIASCLKEEDYLFPTHRGVAEYIGKGMNPKEIFAEYMGKRTGCSKGKGGMHLADAHVGILGLVGSLGADFSVAVGTALASKLRQDGRVTLCYFGEGTSNQADFHPALNMSALWQLPLVFVCANNRYTELAHYRETTSTEDIAPRAQGYGIKWEIIEDGNDIERVYEAASKAVESARSGKGPYFIEFKTYRVANHFTGDPGTYRSEEEINEWIPKDPIKRCRFRLLEAGFSEEELTELEQKSGEEVEEAVRLAFAAPYPEASELYTDVYSEEGSR